MTTASAVLYVRQSFDKTGQGAAVSRQQDDAEAFAMAKHWTIEHVYRDNDLSATKVGVVRPDFERLLADIEAGRISRLIVWHLDRLTRSMRDLTRLIEVGGPRRLNIASVNGISLDLGDPTGVAVAQILTAIAGMESAHKAERQESAHRQRVQEGRPWWSVRPFGYTKDGQVVPEEAELVRDGYQALLRGESINSIAKVWGVGGTRVAKVLRSPRNIAQVEYKGQVMGDGTWEALVDDATYYSALAMLNDPARKVGGRPRVSLLSGLLVCGRCEKPRNMSRDRGTRTRPSGKVETWDRYTCPGCKLGIPTELAEEKVVGEYLAFIDGSTVLLEKADPGNEAEIIKLRQRLDDLTDAFSRGDVDIRALTRATTSLTAKIDELIVEDASRATERVWATPDDIRHNWDKMSVDEQRAAIAHLWPRLVVTRLERMKYNIDLGRAA